MPNQPGNPNHPGVGGPVTPPPQPPKKKGGGKTVIIIILIILALLFCGGPIIGIAVYFIITSSDKAAERNTVSFNDDSSYSAEVPQTAPTTEPTEAATEAPTPLPTEAPAETEAPTTEATLPAGVYPSWQEAYAAQLRNYARTEDYVYYDDGTGTMYDLYDIDGDGTPELFVSQGAFHVSGCMIYTFDGSECVYLQTLGEWGVVSVIPAGPYVLSAYSGMGYHSYGFYQFDGGAHTLALTDSFNDNSDTGYEVVEYYHNNQQVSQMAYESAMAFYTNHPWVTNIGRDFYFYEDITGDELLSANQSSSKDPTFTAIAPDPGFTPDPYAIGSGYVNTEVDALNLRSLPSTSSELITKIPKGDYFNVYANGYYDENGDEWVYIGVMVSGEQYYGYIKSEFAAWSMH